MAHPSIKRQLQEFLYRGFLIPVLGEALLQSNIHEQIAATAYLELIIRTVTEPGLLHAVLQFLVKMDYDGDRLFNILIQRIQSNDMQLCLVSLALFESMIDLNCEDLLLELVFKHLQVFILTMFIKVLHLFWWCRFLIADISTKQCRH